MNLRGYLLICILFSFSSVEAVAQASAEFSADGESAAIVLTGAQGSDALKLFNLMDRNAADKVAYQERRIYITDETFEIKCATSNLVGDQTDCRIQVKESDFAQISPSTNSVIFKLEQKDAEPYYRYFRIPHDSDELYFESSDKKLQIWVRQNSFLVAYQSK